MTVRSLRRWILPALVAPFVGLCALQLFARDAALPLVWLGALTPWLYLPVWILLGWALVRRRTAVVYSASFVAACHAFWIAPGLIGAPTAHAASSPRLRVVTANVLYVNERPTELLEELLATDADVLVLEEVSPRWLPLLNGDAARQAYPHRDVLARTDAFGIAVLSRRPLLGTERVDLEGVPMLDALLEVDGRAVRIFAVHTLPPVDATYAAVWRRQLNALAARARAVDGPLVVAGDLNATTHAAGFRDLTRAGLRDAHDTLGRGMATTWPNGLFSLPPLRLDHVMVNDALVPLAVREGRGEGSDHRPVIVDVAVTPVRSSTRS